MTFQFADLLNVCQNLRIPSSITVVQHTYDFVKPAGASGLFSSIPPIPLSCLGMYAVRGICMWLALTFANSGYGRKIGGEDLNVAG